MSEKNSKRLKCLESDRYKGKIYSQNDVQPVEIDNEAAKDWPVQLPDRKGKAIKFPWLEKNFFYDNPIGRTIAGRNKEGQAIQVALLAVLALTPFKGIKDIRGHVCTFDEILRLGRPANQVNLDEKYVVYIRAGVVSLLIILLLTAVIDSAQLREILSLLKLSGLMLIFGMAAQQGQKFRVVRPVVKLIPGHPPVQEYYSHVINGEETRDHWDDVVTASANVPYPKGASEAHRHLDYIDEHPERFELIDEEESES